MLFMVLFLLPNKSQQEMVCIGFIISVLQVLQRTFAGVVQWCSQSSIRAFAQHQQQQSNLGSIVSSSPVTPTTIQPLLLPAQHTEQHSSPSFHLQDKEQRKCRSVGLCVHVQLPPPRQETNDEENDSIVQYTENTQRKNSAVVGSVHVKITIIKTSLSASSVQKYLLIF